MSDDNTIKSSLNQIEVEPELEGEALDVHLYRQVLQEREDIFLERRQKYGSHLNNSKRFPLEDYCGLYLKCCRMIRMIEETVDVEALKNIDKDTLLDFNYVDLILSSREVK